MKWTTKDGVEIDIAVMTDGHLTNVLRMLRRNSPLRVRAMGEALRELIAKVE